jgi:hypothetical protein
MKCSAVILTQACLLAGDRERLAMTTIIRFFKRLFQHDETCSIPDALLQDIGLTKVLVYFP